MGPLIGIQDPNWNLIGIHDPEVESKLELESTVQKRTRVSPDTPHRARGTVADFDGYLLKPIALQGCGRLREVNRRLIHQMRMALAFG